jgi:tripartite-type tricarboxylate transporter receptor subunit TctC
MPMPTDPGSIRRSGLPNRRRLGLSAAAAALGTLGARTARAQQIWPERPVRLIAPFAPGGPADLIARVLAERLAQLWRQPVVVENRPGAGGNVGAEYVARTPPDGHTLLVAANTLVTAPALVPRLPFDPLRDFTPIAQVASHPHILVVHPSVPAWTLAEFVALARAQPVSYGSGGVGASSHLSGALLAVMAGIELTHVPFGGTAPAQAAVLGGQVQAVFQNPILAVPAVRDGRLRALANTGASRWRDLAEVPTMAELGYPGFEAVSWYGVLGPAGLPAAAVERAEAAILATVRTPGTRDRLLTAGLDLPDRGAAEFRAVLEQDLAKWGDLVRRAGIRGD